MVIMGGASLSPEEIEARIAAWHDAPEGSRIGTVPLHAYLGMTWEEYGQWVEGKAADAKSFKFEEINDYGSLFPMTYITIRELAPGETVHRTIEAIDTELLVDIDSDGNVLGIEGIGLLLGEITIGHMIAILKKIKVADV